MKKVFHLKKTFIHYASLLAILLLPDFFSAFAQEIDSRLFYRHSFAPSDGYVSKIEKPVRKEICLNGFWDFQAVPLPVDYQKGKGVAPELSKPNDNQWDNTRIKIPSPWNINAFAHRNLLGPDHRNYPSYPAEWEDVKMAWMRKVVAISADWDGNKIVLHFEAVAGFTEVYANGQKVGENFDLFLPFDVDITNYVKAGEQVEILVGVRSQSLFEDTSTKGRRIVPAGSMWGYLVNGIWQDVYLLAIPKINISHVFIKPLVAKHTLELEITLENTTNKEVTHYLSGDVREWINKAGTTVNSAPVSNWDLADNASLSVPQQKINLPTGMTQLTIQIPIKEGDLNYWSPEFPNLYGLTLLLGDNKSVKDIEYERFGWREWSFNGSNQLLNGHVVQLKGDSWHFMGVPQLTRRYAWAWFSALKDANANAVRPHAQVYPQFYLDVADEMGICVLDETANWASDGGPKMDAPIFWENSKTHLKRMVLRDRNHASVFGWSISNENKPVILHVFNRPDWMPLQKQAWVDWRDIVREYDPTRPWISADGEDDGDGILPVTVGHYGDRNSMKRWQEIGKPWGIGEHSMAYYGTPEQVAKYNGERAYESQSGRMEGLAYECYDLIAQQRLNGASYVSVFNIAWYALQPLPFGKRDLQTPPALTDGIYFGEYQEGIPGIQPERMGTYSSTFNPGYDPSLPLYRTWPMFDAIKAANAPDEPAWSKWSQMPAKIIADQPATPKKKYHEVLFGGETHSAVKTIFENHGVVFGGKIKSAGNALIIIDGGYMPSSGEIQLWKDRIAKGADVWVWSPNPQTVASLNTLLPVALELENRPASSFIPEVKSWLKNTVNSDFYFCEVQSEEASSYGIKGLWAEEGEILLNACNTNWRKWNKQAEELKTAAVLRSENEYKGASPVFVRYPSGNSVFYISTIAYFAHTEKGYNTLDKILQQAGIPAEGKKLSEKLMDEKGAINTGNLFEKSSGNFKEYGFWLWSPRPLDDLLIEPDMPKLDMELISGNDSELLLNGTKLNALKTLPLKQGWNQIVIKIPGKEKISSIRFICENNPAFISQLKTDFQNPVKK